MAVTIKVLWHKKKLTGEWNELSILGVNHAFMKVYKTWWDVVTV